MGLFRIGLKIEQVYVIILIQFLLIFELAHLSGEVVLNVDRRDLQKDVCVKLVFEDAVLISLLLLSGNMLITSHQVLLSGLET